jgi:hypothetical protein
MFSEGGGLAQASSDGTDPIFMDFELIKSLLAALERQRVRYAVFGAVALNLHGLARFTEDLDLFV